MLISKLNFFHFEVKLFLRKDKRNNISIKKKVKRFVISSVEVLYLVIVYNVIFV